MLAKRRALVASLVAAASLLLALGYSAARADTVPSPTASQESIWDDHDRDNGFIDVDHARESLESRYENPADVALPPKLLIPRSSLGQLSTFDIYQLQHDFADPRHSLTNLPRLSMVQNQSASLASIPLNLNAVKVSFKTPAQEFFDVASMGLLLLSSIAVAMGAFIFFRSKRKDQTQV